jgi:hypothetical protein
LKDAAGELERTSSNIKATPVLPELGEQGLGRDLNLAPAFLNAIDAAAAHGAPTRHESVDFGHAVERDGIDTVPDTGSLDREREAGEASIEQGVPIDH